MSTVTLLLVDGCSNHRAMPPPVTVPSASTLQRKEVLGIFHALLTDPSADKNIQSQLTARSFLVVYIVTAKKEGVPWEIQCYAIMEKQQKYAGN